MDWTWAIEKALIPVLVASITVGVPSIMGLRKFRKENNVQHTETAHALSVMTEILTNLDDKVSQVGTKIDEHLGEHRGWLQAQTTPTRRKAASR
jgi:hypothetical protein